MNEVQLRSLIIKTVLQLKAFLSLHVFFPPLLQTYNLKTQNYFWRCFEFHWLSDVSNYNILSTYTLFLFIFCLVHLCILRSHRPKSPREIEKLQVIWYGVTGVIKSMEFLHSSCKLTNGVSLNTEFTKSVCFSWPLNFEKYHWRSLT